MIYIIENEYLKAYISDLGATLTKLIDKKTNIDLVLGFESDEEYIKYNGANIGASVGRNCNRIGGAKFTINGETYKLVANEGENQLHGGGFEGFAFKRWDKQIQTKEEITLSYLSKDGEQGFPGNLNVEVTYKLDKNNIIWSYSGTSDKDTLLNMTNHSYFCLGDDDVLNHELVIYSDMYCPCDEHSLTLDTPKSVKGTAFDFTKFTKLNDNIKNTKCGIDNNYVWENLDDKKMAEVKNDKLKVTVYSDLPDMHLYTAYYLNGEKGKYGKTYKSYSALCLECQYYPNGINYDKFIKPILKANETMSHYIRYEINNI